MEIENKFRQEIVRFDSIVTELCKTWPASSVIPKAKQYISYLEDIVELHEQHDGAIDFDQILFPGYGIPVSPDVHSDMNSPGYFMEAISHMITGQENDNSGSSPVIYNFPGSWQRSEEPDAGFIERTTQDDSVDSTELARDSMIQQNQASAVIVGDQARGPSIRCTLPSISSRMVPISPCYQNINRDQELLVIQCCTEIRSEATDLNPEAIIAVVGNKTLSSVFGSDHSVPEILDALDKAEAWAGFWALMRRMLLLRLADAREKTEASVKRSRCETGILPGDRKPQSEALDVMVKEANPTAIEDWANMARVDWRRRYEAPRKRIQNRLYAAKNWKAASDRFGCGIVALFPTKDCSFEKLDEEHCTNFLAQLERLDNGVYIKRARELQHMIARFMSRQSPVISI